MNAPPLEQFIAAEDLLGLIDRARREDLGDEGIDVTTELVGGTKRTGQAMMRARQAGRLAGVALLPHIAAAYDPKIAVQINVEDGQPITAGAACATFFGPMQSILTMERVALNFVTHLSGVASLTTRYVAAISGTKARITDTRKTLPGLRALEKYAVVCGGGVNHRMGLHDAVLVKDNHLASVPPHQLTKALAAMIEAARARTPAPTFIEVEVDTLRQFRLVLAAKPDMILLDNMQPEEMREAVELRDSQGAGVLLEASGGVNLQNVARIAATGVDRIAIGALTHSAPALDLGLDVP